MREREGEKKTGGGGYVEGLGREEGIGKSVGRELRRVRKVLGRGERGESGWLALDVGCQKYAITPWIDLDNSTRDFFFLFAALILFSETALSCRLPPLVPKTVRTPLAASYA